MSELPQQVHFLHQQLLLFLAHTAITHLLPHIHLNVCIFQARLQRQSTGVANLPISFSGNLSAGPEGSSSNGLRDLIFVQLRRVSRHRARLGKCGRLSELRQCINRRVQSSLRRIIAHARAYHHGEMNGPYSLVFHTMIQHSVEQAPEKNDIYCTRQAQISHVTALGSC